MKLLILFLALACSCRAVEQPGRDLPSPVVAEPKIEFRGFEYPDDLGMSYGVFELVNPTASRYTYYRQIGPIFFMFDLGNPDPLDGILRCGNGIVERTLCPGDVVRLTVRIDEAVGPIQIRMNVWDPSGTRVELESTELDITESKANRPMQRTAFGGRRSTKRWAGP